MTEAKHQTALFQYAALQSKATPEWGLLFSIPNGAYLGGINRRLTGWFLKQQGLKSGVPDLCLPVARKSAHGLYIELKNDKPKGRMSDEQKEWKEALERQGYVCAVSYGWEQAKTTIHDYLA